jgi:hypothetical protein
MIISCVRDWILFRTNYNEKYDLVQQFVNHFGALERNSQIDFLSSALIEKENGDHWNAPIIINQSNDEAPPMIINGHFIGGGHGEPCCINVYSPLHGKTVRDVGAIYVDDEESYYVKDRIAAYEQSNGHCFNISYTNAILKDILEKYNCHSDSFNEAYGLEFFEEKLSN